MDESGKAKQGRDAAEARRARQAEQLRANLQRRKAQTRARRAGGPDRRPEGLDPECGDNEGRDDEG